MAVRSKKNSVEIFFRAAVLLAALLLASSCSGGPRGGVVESTKDPESLPSVSTIDPADYIGTFDEEMSGELIRLTNILRNDNDLPPFETDEDMTDWARIRAAEIVISFEHIRIDGSDIITAYRGESYTQHYSAIARGYTEPVDMINSWMTLEHQRNNLLNSEYTHVGAACLWHNGICYSVLVFLCP